MKKIICLWGGPGTGKSTTCAGLFFKFKSKGHNTEMNREYVKDWVWEGREIVAGDQVYLAAKQARKEVLYMRKGLEVIVTDSPMGLCTFYGNKYDKYEQTEQACKAIVKQHYAICKDLGYTVDHYFLKRTKPFNQEGRNEDEETSKRYDEEILKFMMEYPLSYKEVLCDEKVVDTIYALSKE